MKNFQHHYGLVADSGLFDSNWYLTRYPDVAAFGGDPLAHFVRFGIRLGRDPGPRFDTRYYLQNYPDVARAGVPPILHYLRHGAQEGRTPAAATAKRADCAERIDIVVPVFNALADVQRCLESLRQKQDGFEVRILVVNDGSDAETTAWLRTYCATDPAFQLIEHAVNRGYTQAVNTGLRASSAPYVITQNSDTVVTHGWLRSLVRCINSAPEIGIVGPLSNAASWQNVPALLDESGAFAVNEIPGGKTPDEMARIVARASARRYPRLPFVNGFCFMIRREVINAIGLMDEENFPVGYGEENDFCIRAADAGFQLAIADDCYVFHAKSKSFGHERRKELSRRGSETLKRKHGAGKFAALVERVKQTGPLDEIRAAVDRLIGAEFASDAPIDILSVRILYLLPVKGGSGGAHSVVQEAAEMRRLGMGVRVAVRANDLAHFQDLYRDVPGASDLFAGFSRDSLIGLAEDYDVVVATIFSSTELLRQVVEVHPHILPAYYVQDYEPMFFAEDSDNWRIARASYTLVPQALLFAKTHWIGAKVRQEHGVDVHKVAPSIDHEVYRPRPRGADGWIHVSAMIRPQTPRRGAERTMRLFSRLAAANPGRIRFHLFGCPEDDVRFQALLRDFSYDNRGVLRRPEVAELLAASDLFVDLSDYQAFGRTALEAMACGAAAVVPAHGGADEYARDGINALVVDSFDEDACFARVDALVKDPAALAAMRCEGLQTAAGFSVHQAAVSEIHLFGQALARHRGIHPRRQKPVLMLMHARTKGGTPTGSAYVRVLLPYGAPAIRREWQVVETGTDSLPAPGSAQVLLIQREAKGIVREALDRWLPAWRAAGGQLIYEIDDDLFDADGLRQRGFAGDARALAGQVEWLARNADLVTVSTPALQEMLGRFNRNVRLLPNCLDPELWRIGKPRPEGAGVYRRQPGDPVRIGYIGTPTHTADLAVIAEAMQRIEKEYGDRVEIEVIGGFQNSPPLFGKRVGLPKRNDYPSFVDWLHRRVHWDIGVIPLAEDRFNKSKSYLKFLEYSALNLPTICSAVDTYRAVCRHGENGFLVQNTAEAWYQATKRLIDDPALRESLAAKAQESLRQAHLINHVMPIIQDLLRDTPAISANI